jgi:outer membrane beta-barrel protein
VKRLIFLLPLSFLSTTALAQETIDVGLLKKDDIKVVQKQIYAKEGMNELSLHVGVMPFDAFSITPKFEISYGMFTSDTVGFEVALGGGYGLSNANYRHLVDFGTTPDTYRYLGSAIADAQWAPIYGKMALQGSKLFHYDVYGLGGGGLTVERAFMEDKSWSFGPTISAGIGSRIFFSDGTILRIQLRDDLILQKRAKTVETQGVYLKQNMTISVGYTFDLRKMAKNATKQVKDISGRGSK